MITITARTPLERAVGRRICQRVGIHPDDVTCLKLHWWGVTATVLRRDAYGASMLVSNGAVKLDTRTVRRIRPGIAWTDEARAAA